MFHLTAKKGHLLKGILVPLLLGAILLAQTSCKGQTKTADLHEKITIAYSTSSNAILVYIAFAKGYFAQEGLDVTAQPHPYGKPALASVLAGKADLATVADTPMVFAIMNGKKITTLATIQTSNRNQGILARRDRGISAPTDLSGKTIGVTLGTNDDFFLSAFLLTHGIGNQQVKQIDLKPDDMGAALASGRVDAISAFNPTLYLAQEGLGNNGAVFYGESLYTETFCLASLQDYPKQHPEAVKKVLRAVVSAEKFAQEHPEEARRLVADFIKIDKAMLDQFWPIFTLRVALDQSLLVDLEEQSRWAMKKLTFPTTMPNYLDFIYLDGLLAVKPDAVRILR